MSYAVRIVHLDGVERYEGKFDALPDARAALRETRSKYAMRYRPPHTDIVDLDDGERQINDDAEDDE